MNRSGQESSNLVGFLILIAVLVLSITLLIMWSGVWRSAGAQVDCGAEVRAHAVLVSTTKELANPTSIHCPTRVITANGEVVAKAVIADEMVRCFNQWGRGELRLFGDKEGVYCHVCGMVYVKDAPEIRGLGSYLTSTNIPGKEITYAQTLTGVAVGDLYRPADAPAPGEDVMTTTNPIAVIFRYEKGETVGMSIKNWFADPTIGLVAGMDVGIATALATGAGTLSGGTLVVAGGILGASTAFIAHQPLDTFASVNVRPLDPAGISTLGCDFAPVED